ncbi:hypothetical protein C7212DRAFT_366018 [Tuber magnatum]|uniref:Uncharacterized protein n=1 Tax=Tuber magnatum TaxID=42249 RepID=A0A317SG01_9PEZI|nr:hypothetical protein C7212DRAFT_366018 [Tuber magnatum]
MLCKSPNPIRVGQLPKAAAHLGQKTVENESNISDEDETPKPAPATVEWKPQTPPRLSPVLQPLRRSPRKHRPMRMYECASSSTDEDGDGDDGGDDGYAPHTYHKAKRAKLSVEAVEQGSNQNAAKGRKPSGPPPPPDAKAKPAPKTAAEKAAARAAAGEKAAATRAANQKALVDRITVELVAEEQRAADAGEYRPGASTPTQIKRRVKREKERMKREAAQEKLGAGATKSEQAAEAKKTAAAQKLAAAAEKRAAGISVQRAKIGEKARDPESKPGRSPGTSVGRGGKASGIDFKNEKGAAQERIAKTSAELEAAELAHAAEVAADLTSGGEEHSAESKEGLEEAHSEGGSVGEGSGDGMELELALEMSCQEAEAPEKAGLLAGAASYGRPPREVKNAGTEEGRREKSQVFMA